MRQVFATAKLWHETMQAWREVVSGVDLIGLYKACYLKGTCQNAEPIHILLWMMVMDLCCSRACSHKTVRGRLGQRTRGTLDLVFYEYITALDDHEMTNNLLANRLP